MSKKRDIKKYKCTEPNCNYVCARTFRLQIHLRKHTGERPFICDVENCEKSYTNSAHLKRHKNVTHNDQKPEEVECEVEGCGKVLANKYALKIHFNTKHSTKNYPFNCSECTQGFYKKRQLQEHFYLHSGDPPFKCTKCSKAFVSNRDFKKHLRSHKTFTCDCRLIFHRWSDILKHRKICCEPRYTCSVCNKKFSHVGNFRDHSISHQETTKRLVYQCPYSDCSKFYFHKRNCKQHVISFHLKKKRKKQISCTYSNCKAIFSRMQKFLRHYQTHFQWVKEKVRKTRKDKGKSKTSMAVVLSGLTSAGFVATSEDNIADDELLVESDKVYKKLMKRVCKKKSK